MNSPEPMSNTARHHSLVSSIFLPFCFLALYLFFDYLYSGLSNETLRLYYLDFFASFCTFIINVISPEDEVRVILNSIISSKASLSIVRTCDGSSAFFLISAAILVFRSSISLTITGLVLGLTLIITLNTIRIVSLYFLLAHNHVWFSHVHTIVAPFLLLSICCGYFAFWAYHANEVKRGGR